MPGPTDPSDSSFAADATAPLHEPQGRSERPCRYAPGTLLAHRYRIAGLLGRGGMGEVYEAEDLELHERIALKVLAGEFGGTEDAIADFRREIQLARRVTHPNVCRVFDVGFDGEGDSRTIFVTMEVLRGMTLSEFIAANRPVSPDVALPIVRELCAALDAAHAAGIIHRDFKSGNVILAEHGSRRRVVVTDFGLARSAAPGDPRTTASGVLAGTPAYMAPEQLAGKELSAATDIYALGVVMYETLTGRVPFTDNSLPALLRRIEERAPNPRTHNPDIPGVWERAIVRCLETDPADRFGNATDVIDALGGAEVARPRGRAGRRRRILMLAAGVTIPVLVATGWFAQNARKQEPVAAKPAARERQSIAILGFRNLSGDSNGSWLSTALSEMLTTEVAAGETLRAIPGEEVARAKRDLRIGDDPTLPADALARLRRNLGAKYVVSGAFLRVATDGSSTLRIDARIQDTDTGETVGAFSETASEARLLDLVSAVGKRLRSSVGAPAIGTREQAIARSSMPASVDAARSYAEGVEALRRFEAALAANLLQRTVASEPSFALAHAALSDAWRTLGYDGRSIESAKRAFELSSALSREERLVVEGIYRERTAEWARAIEIYRSLVTFFPDEPSYHLRLVMAQLDSGETDAARASLMEIRKSPAVAGDLRFELAELWAIESAGLYPELKTAADRAVTHARDAENLTVLAESLVSRAWASGSMGKPADAERDFAEAKALFARSGDEGGVAKVLRKASGIAWNRGDMTASLKLSRESLAIYKRIGQKVGYANALGSIAVVTNQQGHHEEARRLFEEALGVYRELGDRAHIAWAVSSIANTWLMRGELDRAIETYREALPLAREVGDRSQEATTLANLGEALRTTGALADAEKAFRDSAALFRAMNDASSVAYVDTFLADLLLVKNDLAGAEKKYREALVSRVVIVDKRQTAETQIALGRVRLLQGRYVEARKQLEPAFAYFRREAHPGRVATCHSIEAEAFAREGKPVDAKRAIAAAIAETAKSQDPQVRWDTAIAAGRVALAGNDTSAQREALVSLARVAGEAHAKRTVGTELEARLVRAQLEGASGNRGEREALAAVERDASRAGFLLIAAQARQ
jgi:tetratricopeptide (TPR) repeat protein